MPKGMARMGQGNAKGRATGTGEMIRDYFLTVSPEASQTQVFNYVKSRCSTAGWSYPAWHSFSNYFGRLKKLKLVIEVDPDPERDWREPHTYRINPDMTMSDMWLNPQRYLYG
jgi:hypothetical protein